MSTLQWYYRERNGPENGPLTLAQLKAAAMEGKLGPYEDAKEIRSTDETEWKRVSRWLAALEQYATNMRREYERAMGDDALFWFPAWELTRVAAADMDDEARDWPSRWQKIGGKFYDGRMIARKEDPIWAALGSSQNFPDALDMIYEPFAFDSRYGTREVARRECEALGLLTEADKVSPLTVRMNEGLKADASKFSKPELDAIMAGLDAEIAAGELRLKAQGYDLASRRYIEKPKTPEELEREAARQREAVEKNRAFCNVNEVRQRLPQLKAEYSATVATELMGLLTVAIEGGHLRAYPKWLGEAYRFKGEILELIGELRQAVEYYGCALKADPKCGVARRMKSLQAKLGK